jgi:hypothetical protein
MIHLLIALLAPPLFAPDAGSWQYPKIIDREPPELCVVVDNSRESKLLISELGREWSSYARSCEEYEQLRRLDDLRDFLWVSNIQIIRYDDFQACKKHKVRQNFVVYPVYRFDAEPFQHFPKQTFSTPTWPLKTVDVLTNRYYGSLKKYMWFHRDIIEGHHESVMEYGRQFVENNCLEYDPKFAKRNWTYWEYGKWDNFNQEYSPSYYGSWGPDIRLLQQIGGYDPPELKLENVPNIKFEWSDGALGSHRSLDKVEKE